MNIKYYNFDTSIGKMYLFFSSKGVVYLGVSNELENEDCIMDTVNKKFGQAERVDSDTYSFHSQILEYLDGKRKEFQLPLDLHGTDFQKKVWKELINIPYGEIRTYKDIANGINNPKGYRAVGNALNKNPVMIVVPCHRVIGSNGDLVGFAGGLKLKERLLKLEQESEQINI